MSQLVLHNARLVLERNMRPAGLVIRDGIINSVFLPADKPRGLSKDEYLDLDGAFLCPGLIDIHIHGSAGVDVQATDVVGLRKLSSFLCSQGITGFFATFVPADDEHYQSALATLRAYLSAEPERNSGAARLLGVHFEGPFVSHHRCGALNRSFFRTYDDDPRAVELFTRDFSEGTGARIGRVMTLAPEVEGALSLAELLTSRSARVFIGHSQASVAVLDKAFEAGARHITHFPNALAPLHHREPGVAGWGLVRNDVTMDCIADLHHVDQLMLKLLHQQKGADRMALISDAIMPAGLGDGEFRVWDERIRVRGGRTSLADRAEGTLAGSVITLRDAVRNIVRLGVPLVEAVRMASLVPARAAGIDLAYGPIGRGRRADLAAFDDQLNAVITVVGGAITRFR